MEQKNNIYANNPIDSDESADTNAAAPVDDKSLDGSNADGYYTAPNKGKPGFFFASVQGAMHLYIRVAK